MNPDTALNRLAHDATAPVDLAELALYLARDEFPDLDIEAYLGELQGMAHEARTYLRGDLADQVRGLCRYLFHEMGFHGNTRDYYEPANSYLNQVLDRRTGIPISLSLVAMTVGQRAGLAVVGIGLPGHFIAAAREDDRAVLFDPFHGGRLLSPEDCANLVLQTTGRPFEVTPDNLRPLPGRGIVERMLSNLQGIYLDRRDFGRALRVLERLRQLLPNDPLPRRDLGLCLLQTGQPGPALDHLSAYLATVPQGPDREAVRQLLDRARSEVARWN